MIHWSFPYFLAQWDILGSSSPLAFSLPQPWNQPFLWLVLVHFSARWYIKPRCGRSVCLLLLECHGFCLSVYLSTYLPTCVCMYHLSIDSFIFVYVYTHIIIYSFINYFHIYVYVYYRIMSSYPTSNSNPTPQGSLRLRFYICKCLLRQWKSGLLLSSTFLLISLIDLLFANVNPSPNLAFCLLCPPAQHPAHHPASLAALTVRSCL